MSKQYPKLKGRKFSSWRLRLGLGDNEWVIGGIYQTLGAGLTEVPVEKIIKDIKRALRRTEVELKQ